MTGHALTGFFGAESRWRLVVDAGFAKSALVGYDATQAVEVRFDCAAI